MISLVVFCVDKKSNNYQYSYYKTLEERIEVISKSLKIQVDIHNKLGFKNLVFLTNFEFQYENSVCYDISEALCEKNFWGNKYTLPLKYILDNKIDDDIWLHDYDCFPQEVFDFPAVPNNHIGGITTKTDKYINGGSLFIPKGHIGFFKTLKEVYDITHYHRSDEILLNDLFFYKEDVIKRINDEKIKAIFRDFNYSFTPLDRTFNYSFAMAKHVKSLDYIPKTLHFHPESSDQYGNFKGKNIIRKELEEIFLKHCPESYQIRNQQLYRKWRHNR